MIDPSKCNGKEIINFLNRLTNDDDSDLYHEYNICHDSFEFESQRLSKDTYRINFTVGFNNWGTCQPMGGSAEIKKSGVRVSLEEPLDGNGAEEVLEQALLEWLMNHTFNENIEDQWSNIILDVKNDLNHVRYDSVSDLDEIIDKLQEAKTLMK